MNKRYLLQFAIEFLFGILFVLQQNVIFAIIGICGGAVALLWRRPRSQHKSNRLLHGGCLLLCFLFGVGRGLFATSCMDNSYRLFQPNTSICFTGTLTKKEYKNDQWYYWISDIELPSNNSHNGRWPGLLVLQSKEDGGCLDAVYYVEGNVKAFRMAENEGNYDEEQYYRSQMVPAVIEPTSMRMIQRPRVGLREALYTLRKRTAQVYETYLPGEESGILAAMTLGEKRDLSKEAKNLFQDTGISHILAISGLHISLVGMLVFRRLRKRMSNLPAAIITTVAVLGYGMLTGSSVSTNRAVGMFLLLLIATVFGRSYDLLTALAIMSIVLLWQNPYAYQQIGFAFSFVAILGVVMVAQPMQQTYDSLCDFRWRTHHRMDHGKRFHKNAKEVVFSALIAGTGMQLATIPLCAYFFFGFPTYVVCLNLLVLPVLGVLISTGLLAGFLGGLVGAIWGLQSWIAILFFPCHWILYFYEVLCDHTLNLPAARMIVGRPMWWQVLLYYGILLGVVWGIHLLVKQHLEPKWKRARHFRKKQVSRWVIRYVATLSLALLPCFAVISYSSKGFEIDMLSVGQGDGIYIQSPEGVDFFIDGGSSSKKQVGEYVIGPFLKYHGVNRIDYWFVTHPDEDHVNGLMELIGGDIQIRNIVVAETIEENELFYQLKELCCKNNIPILRIHSGDVVGTKGLQFECLYPSKKKKFDGTNENSLCLLLSVGEFYGAFTGDMGEEQEAWLLNGPKKDRLSQVQIDLLKAAHHGSNSSNSMEWLEVLRPKLTIVSAGKNNQYGHPGKEFRHRMEELDLPWKCTIWQGQIRIYRGRNGAVVSEYPMCG